jgi:transcriptional regulator with XRE-family HTH domain
VTLAQAEADLSTELSQAIAARVREELARRRLSRQALADLAKISISTLEKALAGRRPFTLATTIRLEEALGVSLRPAARVTASALPPGLAPEGLGSYSRTAVAWLEGEYLTLRPSFEDPKAVYAYRTEIAWDAAASCLIFRERERSDAAYAQFGEVAVPNQSGHIYLVTNRSGQHRLITVSRPTITGELYGILTTLLSGRGSALTPIAAPIVLLPIRNVAEPTFGRVSEGDANYASYRKHLQKTLEEPFAVFVAG